MNIKQQQILTVLGEFLSPTQAAAILLRTPNMVKGYEKRGRLQGFRIGKAGIHIYLRADVERLAKELGV